MVPTETQIIVFIILILIMAVRQFKEREIKITSMWILPAIVLLAWLQHVSTEDFSSLQAVTALAGSVLGVPLGYLRGKLVFKKVDHDKGVIVAKGNVWSLVIWSVILLVKMYARTGNTVGLVVDGIFALSTSLIITQRICFIIWFKRAQKQRMLDQSV